MVCVMLLNNLLLMPDNLSAHSRVAYEREDLWGDFGRARLPWENKTSPQTPAAVINDRKLIDRQDQVTSETVIYSP